MGIEIERKFLVASDAWRSGAMGTGIRQGYLCADPDRTVRIRLAGKRGVLTVKGRSASLARPEFEYEIPTAEAVALLNLCLPGLVEKTRFKVEHKGLVWEVDEFLGTNEGLVLAECELETEDQVVELPPWVGNEVTSDSRYLNSYLAKCPYSTW